MQSNITATNRLDAHISQLFALGEDYFYLKRLLGLRKALEPDELPIGEGLCSAQKPSPNGEGWVGSTHKKVHLSQEH